MASSRPTYFPFRGSNDAATASGNKHQFTFSTPKPSSDMQRDEVSRSGDGNNGSGSINTSISRKNSIQHPLTLSDKTRFPGHPLSAVEDEKEYDCDNDDDDDDETKDGSSNHSLSLIHRPVIAPVRRISSPPTQSGNAPSSPRPTVARLFVPSTQPNSDSPPHEQGTGPCMGDDEMADRVQRPLPLVPSVNSVNAHREATPRLSRHPSTSSQSSLSRLPRRRRLHASANCGHLTMVRVYSGHLRCDVCHRFGPFGWLYRCTEDREELIRQMIEVGSQQATFDDVGRQLIKYVKPRPRGPETRKDRLSFFDEVTPEQLRTYTPEQIAIILRQRENVKTTIQKQCAAEAQRRSSMAGSEDDLAMPCELYSRDSGRVMTPEQWDHATRSKPWVPRLEDECQHKVCPHCRPNCIDRVYTCLDGVVNGDVPATAATGFGFHLFGRRPVADLGIVMNAGLPDRYESLSASQLASHMERHVVTIEALQRMLSETMRNVSPLTVQQQPQEEGEGSVTSTTPLSLSQIPRSPASQDLNDIGNTRPFHAQRSKRERRGPMEQIQATHTPLPQVRGNEETLLMQPSTEMEAVEQERGSFGRRPLEVEAGVAVKEESVELHVPDIITQV